MRMDAALLQQVATDPVSTAIRVYRWEEPTVTLGYFQKPNDRHEEFPGVPRVRRLTGGGAILHDQEITYSVVIPRIHPFHGKPLLLYTCVHHAIISALRDCGVEASLRGSNTPPEQQAKADADFLCFLRRDPRDIVVNGTKIGGSAQRRRRGATLQHGSVLLSTSHWTPLIRGLRQLVPHFVEADFIRILPDRIADAIACKTLRGDYSPELVKAASDRSTSII